MNILFNHQSYNIKFTRTFVDVKPGELLCYKGSNATLEVAVNLGSAQKTLGEITGEMNKITREQLKPIDDQLRMLSGRLYVLEQELEAGYVPVEEEPSIIVTEEVVVTAEDKITITSQGPDDQQDWGVVAEPRIVQQPEKPKQRRRFLGRRG